MLFAPLEVRGAVVGVLSIQSGRARAFGPRERSIFRTLCGYGAVALANAIAFADSERARHETQDALEQLRQTQDELVQREKLASLGQMVTAVAHELNTPLGVALTAITVVQEQARDLGEAMGEGRLKRAQLNEFLNDTVDGIDMALANLSRASTLVRSFKEVSLDQVASQVRPIRFGHYVREVVESLAPSYSRRAVRVEVEELSELLLLVDPGPIAQVVTNLLQNALVHAFRPEDQGTVRFEAGGRDGNALLICRDDGRGMPPEVATRVFEPFFTTRRGTGGSGLGLHIIYKIVVERLGGHVTCESTESRGTVFTATWPLDPSGQATPAQS